MNTDIQQDDLNEKIRARFKELPLVVQNAITSADVQKQMRHLADTNNLHLDQWQLLENNVMLTLLGFQAPEELAENLKKDLEISNEISASLAQDISRIVFEPIRQELERELEHPEAKEKEMSGVESARETILGQTPAPTVPAPPIVPATPPPTPPTEKAIRAPASGAYVPGEASTTRKDIHDDPYREPPA